MAEVSNADFVERSILLSSIQCLDVCAKDSCLTRIMTLESFGGDLKVFLLRVRVSLPQAT